MCGPRDDGRWHGTIILNIDARALRRLGLHPDQPTSVDFKPYRRRRR